MDVTVTIYPEEGNFPAIARALLEVADNPSQVRYVSHPRAGFTVSETVYDRFEALMSNQARDTEAGKAEALAEQPTDTAEQPRKRRPGRPRKSLLTPEELEAAIAAGTPKTDSTPSKEE